jgi:protein TonB
MKKIISIIIFLFTGIILSAQATPPSNHSGWPDSTRTSSVDTTKPIKFVEVMPKFPGDSGAYEKYLLDNVKYPKKEKTWGKQGTVYVSFTVARDGSITNAYVKKSSGYDALDQEALRVISGMPKWYPGTLNGRPVRVELTQAIIFHLG